MFSTASVLSSMLGGRHGLGFGYPLGGKAEIEGLQQGLIAFAQAANLPTANPGAVTGEINDPTLLAVAAVIHWIPGLPGPLKTIAEYAQVGLLLSADFKKEAIRIVDAYATQIRAGLAALTLKYTSGQVPPGTATANVTVYPAGSVTAFDPKKGIWRVAAPKAAGLSAAGANTFAEVAQTPAQPPGVVVIPIAQFNELVGDSLFRKPLFWIATGGAVAVLVGVGWYAWRRR